MAPQPHPGGRTLDAVRHLIKTRPDLVDTKDLGVLDAVRDLLTLEGLGRLSYYQLLEVGKDADQRALKNNFQRLAKEFHPDLHRGSPFHSEVFRLLNEAYQTLSDPSARTTYDAGATVDHGVDITRAPFQGRSSDNKAWVMVLAQEVGKACYCRVIFWEKARTVGYVGTPSNREAAAELYPWIYHQLDQLCDRAYRTFWPSVEDLWPGCGALPDAEKKWGIVQKVWQRIPKGATPPKEGEAPVHWRTFRRSFMAGAVDEVQTRLQTFRRGTPGMALVRCTDEENTAYVVHHFGPLRPQKVSSIGVDHESYTKGALAGRYVRIHRESEVPSSP